MRSWLNGKVFRIERRPQSLNLIIPDKASSLNVSVETKMLKINSRKFIILMITSIGWQQGKLQTLKELNFSLIRCVKVKLTILMESRVLKFSLTLSSISGEHSNLTKNNHSQRFMKLQDKQSVKSPEWWKFIRTSNRGKQQLISSKFLQKN